MHKNKNIRIALFVLSLLLVEAVSGNTAHAAITEAGCRALPEGRCDQLGACDPTTEQSNGSCMAGTTPLGVCCSKKPAPGTSTPGALGSACVGDSGIITGTCQSQGSCTGGGANIDTSSQCAQGFICCSTANPASGAGIVPAGNGATMTTGLNYNLLEKIPGTDNLSGSDFPGYISAIYKVALVVVVLSAVFMLSVGGFMYLTSAGNTAAMGSAKSVIFDALIGLVIALCAWLVLYVINPDLVQVSLTAIPAVSGTPGGTPGGTSILPSPGSGGSGTCGGLSPQSGVACADASQSLTDILSCIKGKGVTASVSSISDSAGFNTCKNNWSTPPCAHVATSCHYGGGKAKTAAECQKSQAADLSVRNAGGAVDMALAGAIKTAASACGARVNDETSRPGAPHIHISTQTSCCSL